MNAYDLGRQVDQLIHDRAYDKIRPLLLANKETTEKNDDLATLCYLCTIYEKEKHEGIPTIFSKISSMEELLERYSVLKFYLRRMDFDVLDGGKESFYQFLSENQVSSHELCTVLEFSIMHKEKVMQMIKNAPEERREKYNRGMSREPEREEECRPETEICFIICSNNAFYTEECLYYIRHLIVPEGFRVDILTIEEAVSMAAGYNEAMQYSKAKYKVYLHQDTFIINPYFIQDILNVFKSDSKIGMIGMIGTPRMPDTGIMWDVKRYGMIYEQHIYETVLLSGTCDLPIAEVEAIDGLLMITQYDVPWRDDLFDKWDFYDCSQSMEFIRRGYKVVVPRMQSPWCLHDCGFLNMENYEEERQKFVSEYGTDMKKREKYV